MLWFFFSEASGKGHHGGLLALNSSKILPLSSFTWTCPQRYASFPRCVVCNQPTRWQLTLQSPADAVWRQSTKLSPFPCLQIQEKWQAILAEQKDKVIRGQSVVDLDCNCSTRSVLTQLYLTLCNPMDSSLHQAPPSMGFSRQEYWSGLPFLFPGNLPDPGMEPRSPAL